jgi:hypothetical protein
MFGVGREWQLVVSEVLENDAKAVCFCSPDNTHPRCSERYPRVGGVHLVAGILNQAALRCSWLRVRAALRAAMLRPLAPLVLTAFIAA